jgi:uncharacterized Zn finger protein (UPF0148 family)
VIFLNCPTCGYSVERARSRFTGADAMYCPTCGRDDRRIALVESPRPAATVPREAVDAPARRAPLRRAGPSTELVRRLLHSRRPSKPAPGKSASDPRLP